jgi:2-dehydro-3-deoxyphosphogluconate aldolase/(4S)-4-hydroxy-2-oxoglutarate aldolase
MISKQEILNKIEEVGIIAVIRAENKVKAKKMAEACIEGGIHAIEITYVIPEATEVIKDLKNEFYDKGIVIGAGTVLDSQTARISIVSGAQFIVGPNFDLETAQLCNRYQVPYMAGCMTINEIVEAMEAGADVIKIFPGSVFGPDYIKAIKGPLPQAILMPTGGVSLENIGNWIKNGSFAVAVGGKLTSGAKNEDYNLITTTAKKFIQAIKEAKLSENGS